MTGHTAPALEAAADEIDPFGEDELEAASLYPEQGTEVK